MDNIPILGCANRRAGKIGKICQTTPLFWQQGHLRQVWHYCGDFRDWK